MFSKGMLIWELKEEKNLLESCEKQTPLGIIQTNNPLFYTVNKCLLAFLMCHVS